LESDVFPEIRKTGVYLARSFQYGVKKERKENLMRIITTLILSLNIFIFAVASTALAAGEWKVSAAAQYEEGRYGSVDKTETWYFPVKLKRYLPGGDITFTVPYVSQTGGPEVAIINGTPSKVRHKAGPVTTNSGIGDIVAEGSFYILKEDYYKDLFDLTATAKIKLPTADDSKGLGTGEFDEGVGLEFGKRINPDWSVFFDVSYTILGDPPDTDLQNRLALDVGVAVRINQTLTASAFYAQSTSAIRGGSALRDLTAGLEYEVTKECHVFGGASTGLTGASQDYGINAGVSYRF
jgi:outer membrane putative beta-barrel porin/alpha-amylase